MRGSVFESSRDILKTAETPQQYSKIYPVTPNGKNIGRVINNLYYEHKLNVSTDGSKIITAIHCKHENVDGTNISREISIMEIISMYDWSDEKILSDCPWESLSELFLIWYVGL